MQVVFMNNKIIIVLVVLCMFLLLSSPVSAKEDVKIQIKSEGAFITIKLLDSHGKAIKSKGTIHYNITDQYGNYKWAYKSYNNLHAIRSDSGSYYVSVKFDGDSKYNPAEYGEDVSISYRSSSFDPYSYYDNHNWGLNQQMDDYLEYNYWDEDIYDDASTYDGEGP